MTFNLYAQSFVVAKLNYSQEAQTGRPIYMWVNQTRADLDMARGVLDELQAAGVIYRKAKASKDGYIPVAGGYISTDDASNKYQAVLDSICSSYSFYFSQGDDQETHWTPNDVRALFSSLGEDVAVRILRQAAGMIEAYSLDTESRGSSVR